MRDSVLLFCVRAFVCLWSASSLPFGPSRVFCLCRRRRVLLCVCVCVFVSVQQHVIDRVMTSEPCMVLSCMAQASCWATIALIFLWRAMRRALSSLHYV